MKIFELSNETWGVSNSARIYMAKSAPSVHSDDNLILQLLGLLFLFAIVLVGAWYVSKFIGNKAMQGFGNKNINIIETFNMGNNKAIQIVRIANKYVALGIGKEEINVLTHLEEEDIIIKDGDEANISFKEMLSNAKEVLCKNISNKKGSKDEQYDKKEDD